MENVFSNLFIMVYFPCQTYLTVSKRPRTIYYNRVRYFGFDAFLHNKKICTLCILLDLLQLENDLQGEKPKLVSEYPSTKVCSVDLITSLTFLFSSRINRRNKKDQIRFGPVP